MLVPTQSQELSRVVRPVEPPVPMLNIEAWLNLAQAIAVSDTQTSIQAQEAVRQVKAAKKLVDGWGKPAKDLLNSAKNDLMAYLNGFTVPLEQAEKLLVSKVMAYNAEVKRQNDEAARAAAAAEAEAMPWEREEIAAMPIQMTATPVVAGVSTRKKPAEARIVDPVALAAWIVAGGRERILEYVEFRQPALNAKARALGREVEALIPGVQFVQEETLSGR